ncbi:MAG: 16S rRNA (cytosine(1402)-N(4))-methyltransferase [Nitrospirales bacterium]|nr:16S rRNA (cytosine(1402)-N(4))-methyltransferase [Nitrospirales bacterium]
MLFFSLLLLPLPRGMEPRLHCLHDPLQLCALNNPYADLFLYPLDTAGGIGCNRPFVRLCVQGQDKGLLLINGGIILFRDRRKDPSLWKVVYTKPVRPSLEEIRDNPRARSARMRALEAL